MSSEIKASHILVKSEQEAIDLYNQIKEGRYEDIGDLRYVP